MQVIAATKSRTEKTKILIPPLKTSTRLQRIIQMKNINKSVVIIMCIATILSLFGCKKHMVDGPGMEMPTEWIMLELSRSDSYAQHNFNFTVKELDRSYFVTGECRDEYGEYELTEPVKLAKKDYNYIKELKLDSFVHIPSESESNNSESDVSFDELIVLDAPSISIVLTYYNGDTKEIGDVNSVSITLYKKLLPYFRKNAN